MTHFIRPLRDDGHCFARPLIPWNETDEEKCTKQETTLCNLEMSKLRTDFENNMDLGGRLLDPLQHKQPYQLKRWMAMNLLIWWVRWELRPAVE